MNKTKIKIVKLGVQRHDYLFKKIKKYNSKLFDVDIFEKSLPACDYNWGYSFSALTSLLCKDFDNTKYDMCIGFIDTEIERNYFGKRLKGYNIYVISFYQVDEILSSCNIDIFSYMLATIYRYMTRYKLKGEYLTHDETKGCLFDMCGNKYDVIYSCNKPIICNNCATKILECGIESDYLTTLQKEIRKIKKNSYYTVIEFIKKHPCLSLTIGAISTVILNMLSSVLFEIIKNYLQ